MSEVLTRGDEARRDAAAGWLVRLQAADLDVAQATEFDAWLAAHPANAAAYDVGLAVMLELDAAAPELLAELRAAPARRLGRGWLVAGGLAAAAAVALAVVPFGALAPVAQNYSTAKGEHRTVLVFSTRRPSLARRCKRYRPSPRRWRIP